MLMGNWPFSDAFDHTDKYTIYFFFLFFEISAIFFLLNFLTVIVMSAYSKYKEKIDEDLVEQSVFADLSSFFEHFWMSSVQKHGSCDLFKFEKDKNYELFLLDKERVHLAKSHAATRSGDTE